uniref:Uncharacterized protein n=1 Tax=viral metagenome TaxID=1070528 RepID=A0A6M3IMC0_9ZZZZ
MIRQYKQLKVMGLIWLFIRILFSRGNVPVYYHCPESAMDCPLEVEGIEIRETLLGDKVTIF